MTEGLTPFDKKNYKESKRRRKQAYTAAETGLIKPIKKSKKPLIAVISVVFVVLIAAAAVFYTTAKSFDKSAAPSEKSEEQLSDELLAVVGNSSPLEPDYVPELSDFGEFKVNSLMLEDLERLCSRAEQCQIKLTVTKAYVSYDEQQILYENKLSELIGSCGYTSVRAQAEAQKSVPKAGCSEFQSGLLVEFDISDSAVLNFLKRSGTEYGFVLRYPESKTDITSMNASDSVYRYVGAGNAANMRKLNMCLEEYSEYLSKREVFE